MFSDKLETDDNITTVMACAFCGELVKSNQEHTCNVQTKESQSEPDRDAG
jgi:hypothetical protein